MNKRDWVSRRTRPAKINFGQESIHGIWPHCLELLSKVFDKTRDNIGIRYQPNLWGFGQPIHRWNQINIGTIREFESLTVTLLTYITWCLQYTHKKYIYIYTNTHSGLSYGRLFRSNSTYLKRQPSDLLKWGSTVKIKTSRNGSFETSYGWVLWIPTRIVWVQ